MNLTLPVARFQFQTGSIKSISGTDGACGISFQFQTGSIKRDVHGHLQKLNGTFQFQTGSIKSFHTNTRSHHVPVSIPNWFD